MKIYRIYQREHGYTLAYAATLEDAQKLKLQLEDEAFQDYLKRADEQSKKMLESFAKMTSSSQLTFHGEIAPQYNDFSTFKKYMLNDQKFNDEMEPCTCTDPKTCDCTYKTKNSVEIMEIDTVSDLSELRKEEE